MAVVCAALAWMALWLTKAYASPIIDSCRKATEAGTAADFVSRSR
jgi:hypothetical protein